MENTFSSPVLAFLASRQAVTDAPLDLVRPRQVQGGRENQCLKNAVGLLERKGFKVVSGWLYIRRQGEARAQFTQHWWNFDQQSGLFMDCSPSIEENAVHILDMEIATYAARWSNHLVSSVCSSLLYDQGVFSLIDYDGSGEFITSPTSSLTVDVLFARHFKKKKLVGQRSW